MPESDSVKTTTKQLEIDLEFLEEYRPRLPRQLLSVSSEVTSKTKSDLSRLSV